MTSLPTNEPKRAKAQLNVYTSLLVAALLVAIAGVAIVSMRNMEAHGTSGGSPFEPVPAKR